MDENKRNVTFKFAPVLIARLNKAAQATGLKKNTIVEQGVDKRLREIEKAEGAKK